MDNFKISVKRKKNLWIAEANGLAYGKAINARTTGSSEVAALDRLRQNVEKYLMHKEHKLQMFSLFQS